MRKCRSEYCYSVGCGKKRKSFHLPEYYHAFISYGRVDSKYFAIKLYKKLTENGRKIWFDQNDIPLGVDFQNQIDDGITKADNFLFIIAPHSVNYPYCIKEINHPIKYNNTTNELFHYSTSNKLLMKFGNNEILKEL